MDIVVKIGILLVFILFNAFFAAAEIALVSISDARVKTLIEQGDRRARLIERTTQDSTRFLATIQIGLTLISFFTSAIAASELSAPLESVLASFLAGAAATTSFILVTIITALVSLILGELVPKRLALRHAEAISLISIGPINWLGRITAPLVKFLSACTNWILRLTGNPPGADESTVNVEEIKAMVDAARVGGAVGEQQQRIIYGAVELSHITVRAIMVPRVQIQFLKATTSIAEAFDIVSQNAHTRLPVCEDDLDNIVGILHVKDLIVPMVGLSDPALDLKELVRPVRYVPESKLASDLLREMQRDRLHIVIVRDEFGGTAGLVTLEDVLEEIVGEIRDEYDTEEEKEFRRIDEFSTIFKIRASLATVNNELDLHLPRDEAATIAGLFLEELQRSPEAGDRIQIEDIQLLVLEDGQRVQVTKLAVESTDPD
jgi:putative hemolysin